MERTQGERRETRERKLLALMLNDLESNVSAQELETMSADAAEFSDRELVATLKTRLGLGEDATEEELDGRLAFVEEPEVLSGAGMSDPADTPNLSHEDDA